MTSVGLAWSLHRHCFNVSKSQCAVTVPLVVTLPVVEGANVEVSIAIHANPTMKIIARTRPHIPVAQDNDASVVVGDDVPFILPDDTIKLKEYERPTG